ncbi:hypothetical protein ZHAS_00013074 [Anopheles sinensis]|uniref:Uncharacterized protein n=1 Tax=Anopheles sinensis TaxID=74873 RepID=A0A084W4J1_ANOSI|nr:hypothetical protein ZHAS_00013074 [Anopheles sinensis]
MGFPPAPAYGGGHGVRRGVDGDFLIGATRGRLFENGTSSASTSQTPPQTEPLGGRFSSRSGGSSRVDAGHSRARGNTHCKKQNEKKSLRGFTPSSTIIERSFDARQQSNGSALQCARSDEPKGRSETVLQSKTSPFPCTRWMDGRNGMVRGVANR